ncbi:Hsp20 family protein [Antarcticirhabdus aurantiaca]|uniref:Hsp20 family protein n=1 Tax=Antarcticirhabdus aurantiaca TaxID=2606717 RepID=A0ACD4NQF3_9HYPH|nr:Hsp20 family protein [Antarcticirhabdus aurantiaca]WAJ29023.1 Hsp20 family protein [Jeongeuplla avenae]
MSRLTPFSSPLLIGFDSVERTLERLGKGSDGYPPYNIERLRGASKEEGNLLRITLAVAGFRPEDLEVTLEENQLTVRGRQTEDKDRDFLHRGIAARQFQKGFLLAEGMRVVGAQLRNGLLLIDLAKPEPERLVRRIEIAVED